jgi:hypothetical protein
LKIFFDNPYLFEYFGLVLVLLILFVSSCFFERLFVLKKWLAISLIGVPIVYFYMILESHTINIPFTDDYNLLETVHNFRNSNSFLDSVKILFEQVNQHRFAFERIVMLLLVFLTGTVNIKLQILIGNLFLLGILYLLFLTLKKELITWYYFIPVPYMLFNLVYFENAYWGIAAIQNTPLIFFAFLSAYGLGRQDRKGWYIGLFAALITTFTSGSGLLAWIVGAAILGFQKHFKLLVQWLGIAFCVFLFYFLFDYYFIVANGEKVWEHPVFNSVFLFGFLGNALYLDIPHPLVPVFYKDLVWCVILGVAIGLVFLVWSLKILLGRDLASNQWFLWGALMFPMGTGAMFVISRPLSNYLMYGGHILSRRYMIFGVTLVATVYICILILTKNSKKIKIVLAALGMTAFLALNFTSYFTSTVQVRKMYEDLKIDGFFWKNYRTFLTTGDEFGDVPFWNHPTRMVNLIETIQSAGLADIYQFNTLPDHDKIIAETGVRNTVYDGIFQMKIEYRNASFNYPAKYLILRAGKGKKESPKYFVLASDNYTLVLPALPVPHSLTDFLNRKTYYSDEVQYELFRQKLPTGKYDVWMMFENTSGPQKWRSEFTGKKVFLL